MICEKCGKNIPDDSKLCCYCGAAVPVIPPVAEKTPDIEEKPVKKSSKKRLLIGGIALVVLAAVLCVVLLGNGGDDGMVTLWAFSEIYYKDAEGKEILAYENRFDDQGRLIYKMDARRTCFADPSLDEVTTYTYNEYGDCICEATDSDVYARLGEDMRYHTWEYLYDYNENGKKIAKYQVNEDGNQLKYTYEYDETGKLVKMWAGEKSYGAFDDNGNITEVVWYIPELDGEPAYYDIVRLSYDDAGRLVEYQRGDTYQTPTDSFDLLYKHFAIRYDETGNPVECADLKSEAEPLQFYSDGNGNIAGYANYTTSVTTTYVYTKIRVTREQALRLLEENYLSSRDNAYFRTTSLPNLYRMEG